MSDIKGSQWPTFTFPQGRKPIDAVLHGDNSLKQAIAGAEGVKVQYIELSQDNIRAMQRGLGLLIRDQDGNATVLLLDELGDGHG